MAITFKVKHAATKIESGPDLLIYYWTVPGRLTRSITTKKCGLQTE